MVYLKSVLVGIVGAVIAAMLWVIIAFVLPIAVPFLASRVTNSGGSSSAYIDSTSILLAALVGFVVGCYWMLRRSRNPAH